MVERGGGREPRRPASHALSLPCPPRASQAPSAKLKVGDAIWLRGAAKGKEPFVQASVTNLQQNG